MAPPARVVMIDEQQRAHLEALTRSRTAPVRLAERARIVWAAAAGMPNAVSARELSVQENTVRTWRARFADQGMAGLEDRDRPGRPVVYGPEVRLRILGTVTAQAPEADAQWSHRLLAEQLAGDGISASQIGRILAGLDLKPHRVRGWLTRRPSPDFYTRAADVAAARRNSPELLDHLPQVAGSG